MWNISGAGHDAYNDFRSNIDSYTVDSSAYGDGIVETIDPNLIEGISLSSREVNDPGLFWGQHKSDGTMDSFIEVASHIPKLRPDWTLEFLYLNSIAIQPLGIVHQFILTPKVQLHRPW